MCGWTSLSVLSQLDCELFGAQAVCTSGAGRKVRTLHIVQSWLVIVPNCFDNTSNYS